jgi:DNA replication protein
MNNKVISILKSKNYTISASLLKNYKSLGINSEEFIVLIYLTNKELPIICDYKIIASDLNITQKDAMVYINNLKDKGIIEIKVEKNIESKLEEYINLDVLYNKIFMVLIDGNNDNTESSNIYSVFESELGRTLSPIEYELINGWLECKYSEDIILEALKEAVYNGVNNFRYIDRILFEWNKKGIKTVEQAKKNKKEFESKKEENVEVPDFDWLNNE